MAAPTTRIAFIHPDLGIGGAERLVVDAAVGLQELGHGVTVYTSHCDRGHCFDEARDGTVPVAVYGDFLPMHMFHKLHIVCAIVRQLYLVARLVLSGKIREYDFFVVDQLSFCVPLLSWCSRADARVLFYCHFPDQLLAQQGGFLKKMYRKPFDYVEEWTTGQSDRIVVNLHFTKGVFRQTFTSIKAEPGVIYPCVDTTPCENEAEAEAGERAARQVRAFFEGSRYFVSINRFERKKNIELAIEAFARFTQTVGGAGGVAPRLVVAGGYDPRVVENVEYMQALQALCGRLGLASVVVRGELGTMPAGTGVVLMPSIGLACKKALLRHAECLLYTPSHEHFGIVPVESMLEGTPVLAVNNGGPLESVVSYDAERGNIDEATGYTVAPDAEAWARVMAAHYGGLAAAAKTQMGENGRRRAHGVFSRAHMSTLLMHNLEQSRDSQYRHPAGTAMAAAIMVAAVLVTMTR